MKKPRQPVERSKPRRIVTLKVDEKKAREMIPRAYWASLPATQDSAPSFTSPPRILTPANDCGGPSGRVSSNNEPAKAPIKLEHDSGHVDVAMRDAHPDSDDHQADDPLMSRRPPSRGIQFNKVIDRSMSNLPTDNDNDETERWDNRNTTLPKEHDHMSSQTAAIPLEGRDTTMGDRNDTRTDENHDGMDGTDNAGEELKFLREELALLEARKTKTADRFWRAADEARLQEMMQRIKELEVIHQSESTPSEEESCARAAAHSLMPLALDSFLSSEKGINTKNPSKRKTAEMDDVKCTSSDPGVRKKRRVAKTAVKPSKSSSKTGTPASISSLWKLNGNGDSKEETKSWPAPSKAPQHLKLHLYEVRDCALKRPGVDKDTVMAHVRGLALMTKILSQQLEPWKSEGKDSDEITLDDLRWTLKGMTHALYNHQAIAVAMMTNIECSTSTNEPHSRSGLLFDYMGYGKTIEAIALIKSNPPDNNTTEENGGRLTVVVCPASVGLQWVKEIENHCPRLRAALWCEGLQVSKGTIFGLDVLVVSYERLRELHKKNVRDSTKGSPLFQAVLYRLVLDEIHEIKSPKADSVTFKACMALNAKHYWGLSGTPTPNGIKELFPYLLFIRHPKIKSLAEFKHHFLGGKGDLALSREKRNANLTELLTPYVLHRTPKHQLLGEALVNLPETHSSYKKIQLGKEERIIYEKIASEIKAYMTKKAGKRCNKRPKKTKESKDNWALYESALRVRQCVSSPLLLENLVKDGIWTLEQVQEMKEEALSEGCSETPFIDMIRRWIEKPSDAISQEMAIAQSLLEKHQCPGCKRSPGEKKDEQQASCDHIWCKQCLIGHRISSRNEAPDQDPACPVCSAILGEGMESPKDRADNNMNSTKRGKDIRRQPGDDYNGYQPKPSKNTSKTNSLPKPMLFEHLDGNPTAPIPLSAKMAGIVDQVLAWQNEAVSDKIIIFTYFVDESRLIARTLQKQGIEFLYFTGGMVVKGRESAITVFADDPEVKVMLISLECGAQALNLTQANRVIIADPWWNHCKEQQAFGRVHRIGQKKETYCIRFLANDTIDTRMYEKQQEKLEEMQDAIQEFQADKSLGSHTLRDILGKAWYDEEVDDDEVSDYEGEVEDGSEEFPAADDDSEDAYFEG